LKAIEKEKESEYSALRQKLSLLLKADWAMAVKSLAVAW
jgi:hypothetical protein